MNYAPAERVFRGSSLDPRTGRTAAALVEEMLRARKHHRLDTTTPELARFAGLTSGEVNRVVEVVSETRCPVSRIRARMSMYFYKIM